ncbi:MAG TPA: sigma-70 family RNA polymerase sigma factor [Rhodanobacteraceae bacterium]|nr:sigma-70 family RNA polymerase sigma factor [Rhodanobacteraceae bacterium]
MQLDDVGRAELNRNLTALADGERHAFDPVYRTLWPLLVRFIAATSGDRALAEEIAQRAMLKILTKVATFDPSRDALAWSLAIAFNEYRSFRRKRSHATCDLQESVALAIPEHDTPEAIAMRDNLHEAVREVLAALRPTDREAIVAAIHAGQRPPVSAAAFRKRLQRAIANARQLWKRHYDDDRP